MQKKGCPRHSRMHGAYKCYIVIYIIIQHHNDTTSKTDAWRKTQEKTTQEDFFTNIFTSHCLYCKVRKGSRVACEGVLETEHKLHIFTPLLWPSRCVFLVLLMLVSTPLGFSEGPLGRVWLSLPHLDSSCLDSTGNCPGTRTQLS